MGNCFGCFGFTQQLGELKVSDPGCATGESSVVSEYLTAHATESEHGSPCCESFVSARCESLVGVENGESSMKDELFLTALCENIVGMRKSAGECRESGINGGLFFTAFCKTIVGGMEKSVGECGESRIDEIERSKQHWSLLANPLESEEEDEGEEDERVVAEVDNVEVFKALQMHPTWGEFFQTFRHDVGGRYGSVGELVLGEKFAEGAQAELYYAQITWKNFKVDDLDDVKNGRREWVMKVFKEGTFLRHVCKTLPHRYLKYLAEDWENWKSPIRKRSPIFHCNVARGILLESGRFAFLMKKQDFDLRILIERKLKSKYFGPFSGDEAEWLMYSVARAVKWLHEREIVHRDLKASNVLVYATTSGHPKWHCVIADYECSTGVLGTGFFRAPEILRACRDQQVRQRPEVFSKAADVYSYGMTCYEILTGKLPFQGHAFNDYDDVLQGQQPMLPWYVDRWTRALLSRCWHSNPLDRPTMGDIVNSFLDHSLEIREYDETEREHYEKLNQQI